MAEQKIIINIFSNKYYLGSIGLPGALKVFGAERQPFFI